MDSLYCLLTKEVKEKRWKVQRIKGREEDKRKETTDIKQKTPFIRTGFMKTLKMTGLLRRNIGDL
jgi:hypothetical protein